MYALTGQTRARRVCWLNVLSGAKGSSGGGRFCPVGANADWRLVAGWLGAVRMRGEDGHFILRRICGKSPVGASAQGAFVGNMV